MEEFKTGLVSLVSCAIGVLLIGLIVSPTYNAIAWEFNLPQLNYWVICGAVYSLNKIFHGFGIKK
jgi:hypothetical protein